MKYSMMIRYKYIASLLVFIAIANAGFAQTHPAKKTTDTRVSNLAKPATDNAMPAILTSGKWGIYAGVQKVYIGHFMLLPNGKYQVAFSSDETKYAEGIYRFNKNTNSIEWQSGLFSHNAWSGKLVLQKENTYQLQFNAQTFGAPLVSKP